MTKRVLSDPCVLRAMDDEPAFVLLARDPMAPALTRLWVAMRRAEITTGSRPMADLEQVAAAELEAERMDIWRRDANESWRKQGVLELREEAKLVGMYANAIDAARNRNFQEAAEANYKRNSNFSAQRTTNDGK